ncbi:M20/M25/M40 family metallo-hydrolase [Flexivirga meconopsidis]|uniref:M20/M25/M40 family metallo-hydrolase n=1 Tax=Flexivirga meconopsidis TaxID=2977121 RepID=UPI00224058AC|nr:M20/M25/M40 family metallo-hydrolase [Flexivirga meconopsidis]
MRRPARLAVVTAATTTAVGLAVPAAFSAPATGTPAGTPTVDPMQHIAALQQIADDNGGNRAALSPGSRATAAYIKQQLSDAGWEVSTQSFPFLSGTEENIFAERKGTTGDVVMLGGHYDSVPEGPGMSDNATGVAGLLAAAAATADAQPRNTIRLAFWGGEERGMKGSNYYVDTMSAADRATFKGYLNFDGIAAPNPGYYVYEDNKNGEQINADISKWYADRGIQTEQAFLGVQSDHGPFYTKGLTTTGIISGYLGNKTEAQAQKWGGTAGAPFDPCYHQACDTKDNISPETLKLNTQLITSLITDYGAKDFSAA